MRTQSKVSSLSERISAFTSCCENHCEMAENDLPGQLKSFVSSLKNKGTLDECYDSWLKYPIQYSKVVSNAHKLKGSCASVGGGRMAAACRELLQASEDENMERSINAFSKIKCEYEVLHDSLDLISQMEKRIIATNDGGA